MAFAVKYRMEWDDQFRADTYKIDVEKQGYSGAITNLGHTDQGFTHNYSDDDWVKGSEGVFSFHTEKTNTAAYDADFYDTAYQDLKIKFYINSVLKWVGWMKPENTTREFDGPIVTYQISATDGIKDLKDIDYDGYSGTGKQTILQVIKNALDFTAITEVDFFIQCNLYEDVLMSVNDDLFPSLKIDNGAFYKNKDGEEKPNKVYDVLEKCIKTFYCSLAQVDGYWQITNGQEYNTKRDIYDYTTLAASSSNVAYDRQVDITSEHRPVDSPFELSKIPPTKSLRMILRNKNAGTDANKLTNSDFSNGLTGWNNGTSTEAWFLFQVSNETLVLQENDASGDPNTDKSFTHDTFNIASIGNGYFEYSFQLQLASLSYNSGSYASTPPHFRVRITYPSGAKETSDILIKQGTSVYDNVGSTIFPVNETGNYTFEILWIANALADVASVNLVFDDVKLFEVEESTDAFDNVFISTLTSVTGYLEEEVTLNFFDSLRLTEIAAIENIASNPVVTTSWTRYNKSTEGLSLMYLFGQQYLNDHRGFLDLLTIELYDQTAGIHFNSILTYNSKKYRFKDFSKNYKTKLISGTIQEVNNSSDVAFSQVIVSLTSIDGTSTSVSSGETGATQAWVNGQGFLKNVVEDASPTFGGNPAMNGKTITGSGAINITGDIQATTLKVDGTRGLKAVTGSFGTVQTTGAGIGGYGGYNIDGNAVFMSNGTSVGLYDDANNKWFFAANPLAGGSVYYNGSAKLTTTNTGISVTGDADLSGHVLLNDSKAVKFGTGADWTMYSTGTNLYIDQERNIADVFYIRDVLNAIKFKFDLNTGNFSCAGEIEGFATL